MSPLGNKWLFHSLLLLFESLLLQQGVVVVVAAATDRAFWYDDEDSSENDDNNCTCQLPKDASLCRVGFIESCNSAVCYGSQALCDELDPQEKGFLGLCYVQEGLIKAQKCNCGLFCPPNQRDCYEHHQSIEITDAVRGGCVAGGCCQPTLPLCDLERIFFFLSLGYGIITTSSEHCPSSSSFDALANDHGCSFLTNESSNNVAICSNAGITIDDDEKDNKNNYCDISFSGTNNFLDLVKEALLVTHVVGREISFESETLKVSFVVADIMADIAFGTNGIVDLAIWKAEEKGCFTRSGAAVHLMGHSLGAVMANLFALKLSVLYPTVHVRITTAGEPGMLLEPLTGDAAEIDAWSHKERYINGRVLPREAVLPLLDSKPHLYGIYQDYCPIAQALPGGYHAGNIYTKEIFLCESMQPNGKLLYYLGKAGEGCAVGRDDIMNDLPNFPHKGGLELIDGQDGDYADKLEKIKDFLQLIGGFNFLDDIVATLKVITSIGDPDYRDAFLQLGDLHSLKRSLLFFNSLYNQGEECTATQREVSLAPDACPMDQPQSSSASSASSPPVLPTYHPIPESFIIAPPLSAAIDEEEELGTEDPSQIPPPVGTIDTSHYSLRTEDLDVGSGVNRSFGGFVMIPQG